MAGLRTRSITSCRATPSLSRALTRAVAATQRRMRQGQRKTPAQSRVCVQCGVLTEQSSRGPLDAEAPGSIFQGSHEAATFLLFSFEENNGTQYKDKRTWIFLMNDDDDDEKRAAMTLGPRQNVRGSPCGGASGASSC